MSEIEVKAPELKPCPFCGGTKLKTGGDDKVVGVWCLTCQAAGPNHYGSREWNDRADFDARIRSAIERKAEPVAAEIIRGFLDCPEIADCAPEDLDNETRDLERRARRYLSTPPAEPVRDEDKRVAVLKKAMEALRKTAVLLLQNAEGCAVNHYAGDFELHGLPGWLCDARKEIETATAVLSAAPEPFTVGEPVAYLTRRGDEERVVLAKFMTEDEKEDGSNGWTATPLFALSASPSPVGESRENANG